MGNPFKKIFEFILSPNYKRTVGILFFLAILLAIPLTITVVQQQQEIRQRAAGCDSNNCSVYGAICCPGSSNCISWWSDNNNCGGCGIVCPQGTTCQLNTPGVYTNGASCQSTGGAPTPTSTMSDIRVNIDSPSNGQTVQGSQTISASATSTVGLSSIQILVDSSEFNVCFSSPCSKTWNTTTVANGSHTIKAIARNNYNYQDTKQISVNVQNATPTQPPATPTQPPAPPSPPPPTGQPPTSPTPGGYCSPYLRSCPSPLVCVNFRCVMPTPTPTGGQGGGSTQFALLIGLDGIGNTGDNSNPENNAGSTKNPKRALRNVTVEIFDSSNKSIANKNGSVSYDSGSGLFKGNVDMGNLASGNYTVKVKSDGYLKRLVPGIQNITGGQTNNLPQIRLVDGDINGDNAINILDYNIFISCSPYSTDNNTLCNSNQTNKTLADLDDNGIIDQFDYNLFLKEFSVQNGD